MGTRFHLIDTNALSTLSGSLDKVFSTQPGNNLVSSDATATAAGPISRQIRRSGSEVIWYSAPLEAGVISGPIVINLWARETNVAANVGLRVLIELTNNAGSSIQTIIDSSEGVELGTSMAEHHWIETPSGPVTVNDGNRIRIKVFGTDAGGTMAAGWSFLLDYAAPEGTEGFSYVEFTEALALDIYPTPLQDGPLYIKYLKRIKDFNEISVKSQFEDGGVDILEHAADAPQRWELQYDGLTETMAEALDNFWLAHRLTKTFTLIEPRDYPWTYSEGDTIEDVQFESFTKDHEKINTQKRTVVLVKYPA